MMLYSMFIVVCMFAAQGFDFGDPPKKKFTVTPVLETDIALYSAENIPNNFLVGMYL